MQQVRYKIMQPEIRRYLLALYEEIRQHQHEAHDEVEYRWNLKDNEDTFSKLLKFYMDTELRRTYSETKDIIFKEANIRYQVDQNTDEEVWLHKKQLTRIFDQTRSAYMCHSRETPLSKESAQQYTKGDTSKLVRYKKRWSFFDVGIRIDITRVNTRHDKPPQFEIEVEWDPRAQDKFWIKRLDYAISSIHDKVSKDVLCQMTQLERQSAQRELLTFLRTTDKHFLGTLPRTLLKSDLAKLLKEVDDNPYAISLKYDGERRLLYVKKGSKQVVAFSRNMVAVGIMHLRSESKQSAVLDCEFMTPHQYIVFDIVKYGLLDMRANDADLLGRMRMATSICDAIEWPSEYTMTMKTYHTKESGYNSVFMEVSQNEGLNTDGLILTPLSANYSQKSRTDNVFKWKPAKKQTVDCRASINSSGLCLLYVLDKNQAEVEVFGGSKQVVNTITNDATQIDSKIVECVYDQTEDVMKILQVRPDKTKPNYITTAEDVWLAIHDNITVDDLMNAFCGGRNALTPLFWRPTECIEAFLSRLSIALKKRGVALALKPSDIDAHETKRLAILRYTPDMPNVVHVEAKNGSSVLKLCGGNVVLPKVCVQEYTLRCEQAGLVVDIHSIMDVIDLDEAHSIHENIALLQSIYEQFIIIVGHEKLFPAGQKSLTWLDHLELASGKLRSNDDSDFQKAANHFSIALHVYHKNKVVKEYQPELTQNDLVHDRQIIYLPLVNITIDENGQVVLEHECIEGCSRSGCVYRSLKAYSNTHLAEDTKHLVGMFSDITLND